VRHHYRDIASAIASIKQQFGRLGILVNNAAPPRGGGMNKRQSLTAFCYLPSINYIGES